MAVTAFFYGTPLKNLMNGSAVIDWDTDTIKVALLANTYTPNQDTHDFFDDVSASEVSGTGYTAGGKTLTTPTVTYDAATNQVRMDGDDLSWTTATFTARYAVVYKSTGTAATSPLIGYVDFGADQSVSSGTFSLTWDATGVARFDVS